MTPKEKADIKLQVVALVLHQQEKDPSVPSGSDETTRRAEKLVNFILT